MNRRGGKYKINAWDAENESAEIWQSRNLLKKLIAAWLEKLGWTVADRPEETELLVLLPRNGDKWWSVDDLRIFCNCIGGKNAKRVLYINPLFGSGISSEIISDWCFMIRKPDFSWLLLKEWLESPLRISSVPPHIDLNIIREHIAYALRPSVKHLLYCFNKEAKNFINEYFSASRYALKLILKFRGRQKYLPKGIDRKQDSVNFYYGLISISDKFSSIEHDINRALKSHAAIEVWEKLNFKKRFISACSDMCFALHAKELIAQPPQNTILLIDDNPTNIDLKHLDKILNTFLPGFNLLIWNPGNKGGDNEQLELCDLEAYQSVRQNQSDEAMILSKCLNVQEITSAVSGWSGAADLTTPRPRDLYRLLEQARFIIVDILFKDPNGHDRERGYGVIRGLNRLCRDCRKYILENSEGASDWLLPPIIAISYADDINKSQAAFASGAAGFVLKNRLLALPGVLARCRHDIVEPAYTPHQNFHSLYRLPHETIGLLRAIPVPKLQFDTVNLNAKGRNCERSNQRSQAFAKLLTACPKTDLHAHVGSCMTPEFLIISSVVMLLQHKAETSEPFGFNKICEAFFHLVNFWSGNKEKTAIWHCLDELNVYSCKIFCSQFDPKSIKKYADDWRKYLINQIITHEKREEKDKDKSGYAKFRSTLDRGLSIPAHWDEKRRKQAIEGKLDMELFLFGMTHSGPKGKPVIKSKYKDDLFRIYLLYLASMYLKEEEAVSSQKIKNMNDFIQNIIKLLYLVSKYCKEEGAGRAERINDWNDFNQKIINYESWNNKKFIEKWNCFNELFYGHSGTLSVQMLRQEYWRIPNNWDNNNGINLSVSIELGRDYNSEEGLLSIYKDTNAFFEKDPIGYSLATGTRCSNLKEYLDGCELSGAEHLKHPWLIHLYAQQTIFGFIKQGVLYAELRAAASGYENANIGFGFKDACDCMTQAFSHAQKLARDRYCNSSSPETSKGKWIWNHPFTLENAFNGKTGGHFPVKVNIILTGKRHKPTSEMIRESSAGVVLNIRPPEKIRSAADLLREGFKECRIVGFDLAGPEEEYPPLEFRAEYERIAKMNIPITAHAGENAPPSYVESAMHDLRARRLGHGLSLADNRQLINRAREDGVCIELCPVSNFQTNPFVPANSNSEGSNLREYPLRLYLENGNVVCINTDNPLISNTNMVKECFQASYAYGGSGLPIWELLRILRMGFTKAFLHLPERSALLELADQIIFDLFSREDVISLLKGFSETTSTENSN